MRRWRPRLRAGWRVSDGEPARGTPSWARSQGAHRRLCGPRRTDGAGCARRRHARALALTLTRKAREGPRAVWRVRCQQVRHASPTTPHLPAVAAPPLRPPARPPSPPLPRPHAQMNPHSST